VRLSKFGEKCLCKVLVVKCVHLGERVVIIDFIACLNGVVLDARFADERVLFVDGLSSSFVDNDVFEPLLGLCVLISACDRLFVSGSVRRWPRISNLVDLSSNIATVLDSGALFVSMTTPGRPGSLCNRSCCFVVSR